VAGFGCTDGLPSGRYGTLPASERTPVRMDGGAVCRDGGGDRRRCRYPCPTTSRGDRRFDHPDRGRTREPRIRVLWCASPVRTRSDRPADPLGDSARRCRDCPRAGGGADARCILLSNVARIGTAPRSRRGSRGRGRGRLLIRRSRLGHLRGGCPWPRCRAPCVRALGSAAPSLTLKGRLGATAARKHRAGHASEAQANRRR
jgi:hypothetical protein